MPHSLSAKKRSRQNTKRRMINQVRRSALKTQLRKFEDAVHAKDVGSAEKELNHAAHTIDQIAARGTLHRNTAARKKSRLQKRLNQLREAMA